ncbi:unnamed protein product, partial [Mesorhabditis belari]|uniref:alpha-mannosidase n=1 Tax=Mesorhabditis belari TaxID=2138241 RepID=A0AAF3J5H9_9BILA
MANLSSQATLGLLELADFLQHQLDLFLVSVFSAFAGNCSWDRCNPWSKDKNVINVHLIPHTHDDLGWIKTVDEYYYGAKPGLVPVGVQYIYNTVIDELEKHPDRKFSFAETGFLHRWTSSHSDYEKHRLQKLIKTGQIEMIGGGWVQNDEAASHYIDIIDQMTLGLEKLERFYGDCGKPTVGWQIDPFGHSKEMANLYAMMGYTSVFFARMHYLEKDRRLQNKSLEFVWSGSEDLKTQLLTGAFFQDNYGPPPGFCWDALCGDDPIMDNPELMGYNVDKKVDDFVKYVKNQTTFQRHNHVMLLMGSDFQYTNANPWYENMDKLIKFVNANKKLNINVFYSTPSCYVSAVTEAAPHLDNKNDDFFPYASSAHSFWTGYFTSKPAFKRMIRQASQYLQLAKQLDANFFLGPMDDSDVEVMKKASALNQHHDAVTGTARENVTKDYEYQLHRGALELETIINDALNKIPKTKAKLPFHKMCLLMNETVCEETKQASFAVTIFNPLGQTVDKIVRIPYHQSGATVTDDKGNAIKVQISKTFQVPTISSTETAPFELAIPVTLDPLGFRTYFVQQSALRLFTPRMAIYPKANDKVFIENEVLRLDFNDNGSLESVFDKTTNTSKALHQEFYFYEGVTKWNDTQPTGAYIFRPLHQNASAIGATCKLEVVKGLLVQELHRRCYTDDHWGVDEALNEPGKDGKGLVIRGSHWLLLTASKDAAMVHRPLAVQKFNEPILAFASVTNASDYRENLPTRFAGLTRSLPSSVNLLTLEKKGSTNLLLRLEHIFQGDESSTVSRPMDIDLTGLFNNFDIIAAKELTLAGNRNVTGTQIMRGNDLTVRLSPQEIKTFELLVKEKL